MQVRNFRTDNISCQTQSVTHSITYFKIHKCNFGLLTSIAVISNAYAAKFDIELNVLL